MGKSLVIKGADFSAVAVGIAYALDKEFTAADLLDGYYNNSNPTTPAGTTSGSSKCIKFALDGAKMVRIYGGTIGQNGGGFYYSDVNTMITADADSYKTFEHLTDYDESIVVAGATYIAINLPVAENTFGASFKIETYK